MVSWWPHRLLVGVWWLQSKGALMQVTEEGTRASMLHQKRQEAAARVLAIGQDVEDLRRQVEELGRDAHAPQDSDIEQPCDACPPQQLASALVAAAAAAGADETVASQESAADAGAPTSQARGKTAGFPASPLYSRIIAALEELSSHYQSTVNAFKLVRQLGDDDCIDAGVALEAGGRAPPSSGERLRGAAELDQAQSVAAAGHLKPWPSQTAPQFSPLPPRPPASAELTHAGIAPAVGLGFPVHGEREAGQTEVVGHVEGEEEGGEKGQ